MNNSIQSHAENAVVSYQYPYYIAIKISDLLNILAILGNGSKVGEATFHCVTYCVTLWYISVQTIHLIGIMHFSPDIIKY